VKQHLLFLAVVLITPLWLKAQIGGNNVYEFLNLPASARITGLGGYAITIRDSDLNLGFQNPAALNKEMHNKITFNNNFHIAGIRHGYAAYGRHYESIASTFHFGIQYIGYGDFTAADEFGNITGSFDANEYAITFGASRPIYDRLDIGANLKVITSQLESYNSFGLAGDLAATYHVDEKNTIITLLFRNIGGQISSYRPGNTEPVPFEILLGFSKKLKYLPFRFSVTAQHLERWNLLYDNPNSEENSFLFGEATVTEDGWVENLFRHLVFSGEFLFGKKEVFQLRFAYNHFRKKELSVSGVRSLAGFSGGLGFNIKRFSFAYGIGVHHLGGTANHFSIATDLDSFFKKKTE
jgi:hypothetical protein